MDFYKSAIYRSRNETLRGSLRKSCSVGMISVFRSDVRKRYCNLCSFEAAVLFVSSPER